jgi:hypothetical protein
MVALWIISMAATLVVGLLLSRAVTGRLLGILVDSRRKMSLSRFQVCLWTWVIGGTLVAVLVDRVPSQGLESVSVLNGDVLALMGISLASTGGAALVKGSKAGKQPDKERISWEVIRESPTLEGVMPANRTSADASPTDMVKGEGMSDFSHIDIAKVQMLFFTVVIVAAYVADLLTSISGPPADFAFPTMPEHLVPLLGFSHAGYLAAKAAPSTPAR